MDPHDLNNLLHLLNPDTGPPWEEWVRGPRLALCDWLEEARAPQVAFLVRTGPPPGCLRVMGPARLLQLFWEGPDAFGTLRLIRGDGNLCRSIPLYPNQDGQDDLEPPGHLDIEPGDSITLELEGPAPRLSGWYLHDPALEAPSKRRNVDFELLSLEGARQAWRADLAQRLAASGVGTRLGDWPDLAPS